jgi:hypothetical protein
MVDTAALIWADLNPDTTRKDPPKSKIREWGKWVEDVASSSGVAGGTVNAQVPTWAVPITNIPSMFEFASVGANTSPTVTVNPQSLGAMTLIGNSRTLAIGDTGPAGYILLVEVVGSNLILLNPYQTVSVAPTIDTGQFVPFPAVSEGTDITNIYPKTKFGLDWPTGLTDAGNSVSASSAAADWFISLFRSLYGTAIQQVVDITDSNYNYIANVGVSSGTQQYGGASLQTALFEYNDALPNAPYEEDNPIESHGFRDDAFFTNSPNPPSLAAVESGGRTITTLSQMSYWFARRYRGNRAAAIIGANDELSEVFLQKRTTIDNIGTVAAPVIISRSFVTDVAIRRQTPKSMRTIDILSGYHRTSTLGNMWEYDPRTAALTRCYPFTTENLNITAVALTNRALATQLAAGQTITAPDSTVITLAVGNTVLLQNQTTPAENGMVTITAGVPNYFGSPPIQVSSPKFGTYNNTAANTWIRTYNYGSKPIIIANAAGTRAFGVYSPQIPLTGEGSNTTDGSGIGGYIRQQYQSSKDMNGWELQIKNSLFTPLIMLGPDAQRYKAFCCFGTLAQVQASLQACWNQWGKVLRPSVFDWTYVRNNNRGIETWTEDQVRLWYLCRGADQGVLGKASPSYGSFAGKPGGTTNYNWVRDAL